MQLALRGKARDCERSSAENCVLDWTVPDRVVIEKAIDLLSNIVEGSEGLVGCALVRLSLSASSPSLFLSPSTVLKTQCSLPLKHTSFSGSVEEELEEAF